tara:strand:+ start:538 stop:801 length:264 start_codon:yes stop_codon:yes gene_type:complete
MSESDILAPAAVIFDVDVSMSDVVIVDAVTIPLVAEDIFPAEEVNAVVPECILLDAVTIPLEAEDILPAEEANAVVPECISSLAEFI